MKDNASAFHAAEYDNQIKKTLPYYEDFYKQVVDVVKIQFDKPLIWVDIGCGTGKMAEVALGTLDIDTLILCDSSAKMTDIVKERFHRPNVEFVTASVLELETDITCDVITAIQVFHYLQREERIKALTKCYNTLNPNGVFITFENFAPFSEAGKRLYLERWKTYQLSQGKSVEECERHIGRYEKGYFPISISEHLKVLEQCGFKNAEILWVSNMQIGLLGIK